MANFRNDRKINTSKHRSKSRVIPTFRYGDAEAFRSDNERECREHGKVYVRGHYTRDGDWVKGYCRKKRGTRE